MGGFPVGHGSFLGGRISQDASGNNFSLPSEQLLGYGIPGNLDHMCLGFPRGKKVELGIPCRGFRVPCGYSKGRFELVWSQELGGASHPSI